MVVVFGNVYTAENLGIRLKQVCCEGCGGWYFYEMIRVATGKGSSLYMLDNGGAQDRALWNAKLKLARLLDTEIDPVPCPGCGRLQQHMIGRVRPGSKLPVPGMPPALVLNEEQDPESGAPVQRLVAARPLVVEPVDGWVYLQLPRLELPESCCACGGPAETRYVPPLKIDKGDGGLRVHMCRRCAEYTRQRAWLWAAIGWVIAGLVFVTLAVAIPGLDTLGRIMLIGGGSLLGGLILMFVLPSLITRQYDIVPVDAQRAIYKLRFRSESYAQLVAAQVTASLNAGQVFVHETEEAAAALHEVVDD